MARNLPLDDSRNPITNFDNGISVKKSLNLVDFTSSAISPLDIFTVTGVNLIKTFAVVNTTLTDTESSVSLSLGFAGSTSILLGENQVDTLTVGELVTHGTDGKLVTLGLVEYATSAITQFLMRDGTDMVLTMTGDDAGSGLGGIIDFYCVYVPMSDDAVIAAA